MTRILFVVAIAAAVAVMGCGKSAQQKKLEEAAKAAEQAGQTLQEGANKMAEAMKGLEGSGKEGKTVEPVDFRESEDAPPGKGGRYGTQRNQRGAQRGHGHQRV